MQGTSSHFWFDRHTNATRVILVVYAGHHFQATSSWVNHMSFFSGIQSSFLVPSSVSFKMEQTKRSYGEGWWRGGLGWYDLACRCPLAKFGGYHDLSQGMLPNNPMCCSAIEGAVYKCEKRGCQIRLVVLYGFVWATDPSAPLRFAHRGPNHTVRHRPRYHDFWCDQVRDCTVNTSSFVRQENDKAQRLFDAEIRRAQRFTEKFGTALQRLLPLLPSFEDDVEILLEVDPKLRDPLPQFQRMDGPPTWEGPLNSWCDAQSMANGTNRDLWIWLEVNGVMMES